VRVTADDLVADPLEDRVDVEGAALLRHARLEHDLQREIAQLLAQRVHGATVDGVDHLVRFLDEVRAQALERLLPIPGTPVRTSQPLHDATQPVHLRHAFPPRCARLPSLVLPRG
jgi:hypothetical protein